MSAPTPSPDLLDLKMMPSWVTEPAQANDYSNHPGEDERSFDREGRRPPRGRDQRSSRPPGRGQRDERKRPDSRREDRGGGERRPESRPREREREPMAPLPQVEVRFLPRRAAFESVIAQIKSGTVAYSVFALARLFLDKPERYDVRLTAAEGATLHQLGENGPVSTDPRLLEASAFPAMQEEFYDVEQTQTEPIKGNFTNVARCRLSGTLLGPTNHHSYQPQLRSLYEQRFSRRMSFQDYQRQIEVVSDPAVVEQWKEQARSITTYREKVAKEDEVEVSASAEPTAIERAESEATESAESAAVETAESEATEIQEAAPTENAEGGAKEFAEAKGETAGAMESAETGDTDSAQEARGEGADAEATKSEKPGARFSSIAEAERHFRQTHLPALMRSAPEFTLGGVESRRLQDRGLGRVIEDAWTAETRSPSKMMQELASGLRESGLNIFRHRRGMLFVSPIRIRSFGHERSSVSGSINTILAKLVEFPGMNRKQLLERMTPEGADAAVAERAKAMLMPDLRWLITEGYVMEFNDGTLDLPRTKAPAPVQRGNVPHPVAVAAPLPASSAQAEMHAPASTEETPIAVEGGISIEQSMQPTESDARVKDELLAETTAIPEPPEPAWPADVLASADKAKEPVVSNPDDQGAAPLSEEAAVPSPS